MGNFKRISIFLITLIMLNSCNDSKSKMTKSIRKVSIPKDCMYCYSTEFCSDVYAIENFSLEDSADIDSINRFVLANYSMEKLQQYSSYSIDFYKYDYEDYNDITKEGNTELTKRSIAMERLLIYKWHDGHFSGLTTFKSDNFYRIDQPVELLNKTNINNEN